MNSEKIPLIKEYRIDNIIKCIECIDKYAFNRDKQKDCILSLYPDSGRGLEHRDKSIFRGMVIPSLRYLGLIVGYGDSIRVGTNGKLIIESQLIDQELHKRVLRAVTYEVDKDIFHFINIIKNSPSLLVEEFVNDMYSRIDAPSEKQKKERISNWLSILKQVELVNYSSQRISINKEKFCQTLKDMDVNLKDPMTFKKYFFETYFELSKDSAGVVAIVNLRDKVSIKMLKEHKVILTEEQFDKMLRNSLFETDEYIISLGKPMGAREKLFEYKGNYFGTVFIRTRKRGGK